MMTTYYGANLQQRQKLARFRTLKRSIMSTDNVLEPCTAVQHGRVDLTGLLSNAKILQISHWITRLDRFEGRSSLKLTEKF